MGSDLSSVMFVREDPEAHKEVRGNRTADYRHEFCCIGPQCGIGNHWLQRLSCEPQQTIAIQDFQKQDDDKAYHFSPCRFLLVPKRPVLVQEKTRQRATGIGD